VFRWHVYANLVLFKYKRYNGFRGAHFMQNPPFKHLSQTIAPQNLQVFAAGLPQYAQMP